MIDKNYGFNLSIADLYFLFTSVSRNIILDTEKSAKSFIITERINSSYSIIYSKVLASRVFDVASSFSGKSENNGVLDYIWDIYKINNTIYINILFNNREVSTVCCILNPSTTEVKVEVQLSENINHSIKIDPLLHPLGSLMLMYIMNWNNAALIHASGVVDNRSCYLFTGVSGIGKSTMAKLWQQEGASILNDDRLILRYLGSGKVQVYNHPMPYYIQESYSGVLRKVFLLSQSPKNYVKKVTGVKAFSKVLSNFIQQFYDASLVKKHLDIVEQIISNVEVYELGFKPDAEIVELIRNLD